MPVGIQQISGFLPHDRLDNIELIQRLDVSESFLKEKLGIESRRVCPANWAASDLAVKAAEKLFDSGLKKEAVDLLIVCTQNPDYKLPNTASIVQDKLGLPNSIASFDLNQGCSGFIYSLAAAKSMMKVLNFQNALIITVDPYSKIIEKSDKNTALLFGDAAAAIWVSAQSNNEILEFSFGTDGSGFDKLIVRCGGSKTPFPKITEAETATEADDPYLRMDGRAIFEFMMKRVPVDITSCLRKNNLTMDNVSYFVFHQASRYMLKNLQKTMSIPDNKMVFFLKETGNTVSSSIPLALENMFRNENMSGKVIVLSGFGVGLSWGSVAITFN